ncbi:DUF3052 domain-containing protein [Paenibacillus psychroresistens]|uniref:DUF3052 domain-containing protein n=1 Tax=Paenibacillus psychroresistens TaxID=1778678 RepID=A0A6B8RIA1_9BACL|nr:DUF3052 domain-containing protein [Paenibacillus psychroresistens]QGQ95464.1 DUF3052 domain-containing protein [Paenibacillus psychroresistens]
MNAGYSGTPLIKKLGIKEGYKICVINGPDNYWELLGSLPSGVEKVNPNTENIDFLHVFLTTLEEYEWHIQILKTRIDQKGMIWISWPKKSSELKTDLNENLIRSIAIKNQLVDVKVSAMDEIWSAIKLVIPVKFRD